MQGCILCQFQGFYSRQYFFHIYWLFFIFPSIFFFIFPFMYDQQTRHVLYMHEILMNKEHLTLKYLNYNLRSGDWQACISLKQSGIELHFKNNQDITSDPHFSSSLLTRIMTRSRINLLTIQLEKPAPVLLHNQEKLNS